MATVSLTLASLDTVLTSFLVSDRSLRLKALNLFRAANSEDPVDYVVNAHLPEREAFDTALEDFGSLLGGGGGGSRSVDTEDFEVILTHLLVADRVDRMRVLNVVRTVRSLPTEKYVVNAHLPDRGTLDAALTAIENVLD